MLSNNTLLNIILYYDTVIISVKYNVHIHIYIERESN